MQARSSRPQKQRSVFTSTFGKMPPSDERPKLARPPPASSRVKAGLGSLPSIAAIKLLTFPPLDTRFALGSGVVPFGVAKLATYALAAGDRAARGEGAATLVAGLGVDAETLPVTPADGTVTDAPAPSVPCFEDGKLTIGVASAARLLGAVVAAAGVAAAALAVVSPADLFTLTDAEEGKSMSPLMEGLLASTPVATKGVFPAAETSPLMEGPAAPPLMEEAMFASPPMEGACTDDPPAMGGSTDMSADALTPPMGVTSALEEAPAAPSLRSGELHCMGGNPGAAYVPKEPDDGTLTGTFGPPAEEPAVSTFASGMATSALDAGTAASTSSIEADISSLLLAETSGADAPTKAPTAVATATTWAASPFKPEAVVATAQTLSWGNAGVAINTCGKRGVNETRWQQQP